MFKLFYILYLFCTIFLTAPIGDLSLTPRQFFSVIMLLFCFSYERRLYNNKYWNLYYVYIILFGISSLYTNFFDDYLLRLVGDFFVAYVACWATKIIIEKYDGKHLVIYFFIAFGLFDSIITIGQVLRWPLVNMFTTFFNLNLYESYNLAAETNKNLMEYAIPGFFRNAVDNGHFLSTAAVASVFLFEKKYKIIAIACTAFMLYGSFMAQQRSGFYIAVILCAYLLYKLISHSNKKYRLLYTSLFVIILIILYEYFLTIISSTESRVSQIGVDSTGRDQIWSICLNYIIDNLFLGGFFKFVNDFHLYPHNVFLNAFLSGGIIGGIVLLKIIILQLLSVKKCFSDKLISDFGLLVLAMCFLAALIDSCLHNISLANGDVIIWILWTSYYYSNKSERDKTTHRLCLGKSEY